MRRSGKEKFIQKAIKEEGALREHYNVAEGEKIPVAKARAYYKKLQEKAKGDATLNAEDAKLFDRLHLFLKALKPAAEKKKKTKKASFRSQLIKVAYENPEFREDILPLVLGDD